MKVIGVSGQTGAGKSTFAALLSQHGLGQNLEVDAIGHDLLQDALIIKKLTGYFGEDILDDSGKISRKALGRKAFASEENMAVLNAIMHPAMIDRVKNEIETRKQRREKYLIINAALLFSMGLDKLCNRLVYVAASPEIRLKRLIHYRNWSEESARERLFAQDEMPMDKNVIVVNNDGSKKDLAHEAARVARLLKTECEEKI
ncbi:MAG: dephospho-CoA kinase [Candidatus Rifleibacteriota bacterium]